MAPILEIKGLCKQFGGLRAVCDFDLELQEGDLAGLIGPNGAGKTTVFNLITGVYPVSSGEIRFQGASVCGRQPYQINQFGVARTFQNIRLFPALSVLDNVRVACHAHGSYSTAEGIFRLGRHRAREREITERAREMLSVFNLLDRQDELARNLPYGAQRRVEIARALAAKPRLLLLDEPAAGMNPSEVGSLMDMIRFIRERFQLTILLIEHQMRVVMGICEHITVMDFGQVIARGKPQEIQNNPQVIEAYLGRGAAARTAP
ncbi:MAG: ABC transporter ATP-binding protein [Anaerolineae bacterium]